MAKESSLFRQLEIEAFRAGITPRTKQSIKWFRDKARQLFRGRTINERGKLMKDEAIELRNRPRKFGFMNMYMFYYHAKHRDTLPYYDGFPLILMMGPATGGFYGVNLHYLPPILRARLLDVILGHERAAVPQKYLAAAQKHYLTKQVRSRFALVDMPEWEIATFLPTADWRGAKAADVYRDTRAKIK